MHPIFRALPSTIRHVFLYGMQGLQKLQVAARKLEEILKYRVEANLAAISRARLLDLPAEHAFTCEEFPMTQVAHCSRQIEALAKR